MLQSKHSLERHRFFPYIAWALVLGFMFLVYTIAQDLRKTSKELGETAAKLEARANTPAEEITDFSR